MIKLTPGGFLKVVDGDVTVPGIGTFGGLVVDTNTLVVDAVNHRVGVLTAAPVCTLDVRGGGVPVNLGEYTSGGVNIVVGQQGSGKLNAFLGGYTYQDKQTLYFSQNMVRSGGSWSRPDSGENTSVFLLQGGNMAWYTGTTTIGTGKMKLFNSGGLTFGWGFWAIDPGVGNIIIEGSVGVGTSLSTAKFDINSDILRLRTAKTPATAGAAGNAGDICWDAGFIYACVAASTWKRAALVTW